MVIAFGGALSLSRVLWKSAYSRSNMKPKSIPKQARKWIEELFCWFQVLRQHFMFLSFCIRLPFIVYSFPLTFLSFSFHVPFMCINFPVYSCNIPFIFISKCILVLSFSFHFLSFCIHVLSFHFKSYGNGSMAWPGDRVQQMVIAKLSLRLSLNNPSNI